MPVAEIYLMSCWPNKKSHGSL